MGGVWRPATRLRWRYDENERLRRNHRQTERIRGRTDEDVCRDRASGFLLVIGDRARALRNGLMVILVPRQMRMQRLTVMMLRLISIEMHVQERRTDRACLHQHGEGGGSQPARHPAIVVKDARAGT